MKFGGRFFETKLLLVLALIFISCKFIFFKYKGLIKVVVVVSLMYRLRPLEHFKRTYLGIFLYYKHGLLVPHLHTAFPHAIVWDHHMCES